MRIRHLVWACCLTFALFFMIACSNTPSNTGGVGQTVNGFDDWPDPQPFLKEPTAEPVTEQITRDNIVYNCTTTPFTLTNTPAEVVTFQPNASLFWAGNLLQGKGIQQGIGSFGSIPVEASKRAPFIVSIDLLTGDNSKRIDAPSQSVVDSAVGELIEKAQNSGLVSASRAFFESESSFQPNQIALELELATEYLSSSAQDSLDVLRAETENTVTAYFVEKAFTVNIDFEGRSGASKFFNESFSQADLDKLEQQGVIANDNLPTYLASITYGRVLMFSVTSQVTASILKELIDALNKGIDGNGANALTPEQKTLLNAIKDRIKVVGIGGPQEANSALISSGDLSQYFAVSAPLTSMVPISYELKTVKGDTPAVISRTTSYEQKECTPAGAPVLNREGLIAEFTQFVRIPSERQMLDTSGKNNHGFLNTSNSTELASTVDRFGFADKAINFRGQDAGQSSVAEIRSTAGNGAIAYGDDYSMAAWIQGTRFGYIIGPKEETDLRNSAGLVKAQGVSGYAFEIPLANDGAGYILSDPDPPSSDWTFYVVTIDRTGIAANIKLYRDGVLIQEGTLNDAGPDVLPTASPFLLGARASYTGSISGGPTDFQGALDDIRIYDRVLSADEVSVLYRDGGWTGNP